MTLFTPADIRLLRLLHAQRQAGMSPVMSPAEVDAYMADHPKFAARVAERGQELAEQYAGRMAK